MKANPHSHLEAAEKRIAALITPELEMRALHELESCLDATTFVRASRGPDGISYQSVPDRAIRLAAAVKIIEFSRGKPASSLVVTNSPQSKVFDRSRMLSLLASLPPELVHERINEVIEAARKAAPINVTPQ